MRWLAGQRKALTEGVGRAIALVDERVFGLQNVEQGDAEADIDDHLVGEPVI